MACTGEPAIGLTSADDLRSARGSGCGGHVGKGKADCPTCLTLQCAVYGARIMNEVASCPWISHEEFGGEHVGLEPVAWGTRSHDVAGCVRAALGKWLDVIERGMFIVEGGRAIDATPAAVAQGSELDRALLLGREEAPDAAHDAAGCTAERNAVTVSSGHCTSLEKTTPRTRKGFLSRGVACFGRRRTGGPAHAPRRARAHYPLHHSDVGSRCSSASGCVSSADVCAAVGISGIDAAFAQEGMRNGWSPAHLGLPVRRSLVRLSLRFLEATGSRNAAMMRAACTSSTVRSGISEPANGRGMSNPSPERRGMTWT